MAAIVQRPPSTSGTSARHVEEERAEAPEEQERVRRVRAPRPSRSPGRPRGAAHRRATPSGVRWLPGCVARRPRRRRRRAGGGGSGPTNSPTVAEAPRRRAPCRRPPGEAQREREPDADGERARGHQRETHERARPCAPPASPRRAPSPMTIFATSRAAIAAAAIQGSAGLARKSMCAPGEDAAPAAGPAARSARPSRAARGRVRESADTAMPRKKLAVSVESGETRRASRWR